MCRIRTTRFTDANKEWMLKNLEIKKSKIKQNKNLNLPKINSKVISLDKDIERLKSEDCDCIGWQAQLPYYKNHPYSGPPRALKP